MTERERWKVRTEADRPKKALFALLFLRRERRRCLTEISRSKKAEERERRRSKVLKEGDR